MPDEIPRDAINFKYDENFTFSHGVNLDGKSCYWKCENQHSTGASSGSTYNLFITSDDLSKLCCMNFYGDGTNFQVEYKV